MGEIKEIKLSSSVTRPEVSTYDNDGRSLKEQEKLYNDRYKKDTTWRCRLSWWVIIVDSVWLLSILIILMINNRCLKLSDIVLITLLGTTTINILGLAFIILRGLFDPSSNNKIK